MQSFLPTGEGLASKPEAFALKKGLCLDLSKLRAEDSTPYDPKALPVGIGGAAAVASPAIPKLGLGKPPIPALKLGLAGLGAVSGDGSAAGSEIKPADLRALLKLDLGSISQAGDAQRASGRDGETRPTWEFDLSEITLGHRIGAGAFGEVYEASWRRSRIAVKRLLCQRLTETARREFMQEMQLMSNLRHPHIVRFLGACLEPLQMSILFELCASSLYTVLHVQKQPLQLEYAMGLIRQIALGIFYLHQCKEPVLHLDLKSANVLLDEHGVAKVADFGLSHIKKETAVITARMGSPQWTAPEILRGQPHDESADTYSFGVLMYEIMAARLPYLGIDTFQVVMGVITKMLPRPQLPAECAFPQLLQEMMANCWRESPQERPRFNAILDMADEALETLAMRPQLAGAGGKKAKHAIALDVSRSQRSPPSSHGSDRASSRYGSDRGSTARSAMLETPPRSSYGSGYGSATETDQPQQPQPRQLLKLGLPSVAPNLALQQGGALALHDSRQANRAVAIALVDYVGQAFDELSFKRGDTIRDVEPHTDALGTALRSGEGPISPIAELRAAGEGGLWMGTLRGRRGLFRGAQVCMSRLGAPTGGVAHTETPLAEAYDMVGATLLSAGHGYEIFSATALDGLHGPPVQLSLLRADDPDWRARAERHAALMSEVTAAGASHVLPLLRVQILGGLSQLHTLRICHGNLQPAAVLFESPHLDETALRLADLRCARQLPAGAVPSATALERATGVPDYSSPEALSWMVPGARRVGFGLATDIRQSRSGEWELGAGGFGAGALGKTPSSEGRSAGAGGAGTHHPPTLRVDAARAATPFNLGAWIKSKLGFTQRQLKVLLLGLDAAGKSTLLQRLRHGDEAPATSMPTIGHDVERFEHAEAVYTLYDVGGQRQLRGQWERYFALEDLWGSAAERVSGIIFVVDAADASRFGEARQELHKLLSEPRLRGVPLLVLANKMDLPTARPLPEVEAALGVAERDPRPDGARCAVQGACSLCGDGVVAALEWIAAAAPA
ncbi:serine threonine protein kinase [Chrysochromulina tobinii]|uniref:mitogen-activated protein kinase kinase kinase n=1 Tax=Chrysochromulina tobinii TaxID=1460289 RepID=A0A0M0JSP4_9EUKA|nr:serine threonine protein kinase [Chrysochromulina tobinii]|eukprot:KOO29208.1 serine threonine protein kinase [Chrysochromulina sp. CCMP291]